MTGGIVGDEESTSSVECYHADTNIWSTVENMNIARDHHGLVSLLGRLYAVGGQNTDSVEVYHPDNNTWTPLEDKLEAQVAGVGCMKKYYLNNIS